MPTTSSVQSIIVRIEDGELVTGGGIVTEDIIDNAKPNICLISEGNYPGNNTINRAIPHGLGVKPKKIIIAWENTGFINNITRDGQIEYLEDITQSVYVVTAWDENNFYVGNSSQYNASANGSGYTYYWKALS